MPKFVPPGLGWHPDLPDGRDLTPDHERVAPLLATLRRARPGRAPRSVDWGEYLPPAENQGALACSSAHAVAGLVAYLDRRAFGNAPECSCLFLYRMTRVLLGWRGDAGAPLRATLKTLARFGLPPRRYCPDDPTRFDGEPAAFLYSYAREYQALLYVRLGAGPAGPAEALTELKGFLAAGLPVVFGFTVFSSLEADPDVPFPTCFDAPVGGQAVLAVGYDDARRVRSERGALRVRSSWGPGWGEDGCGWLPYRYVTDRLAADFWTVLRPDWLAGGDFVPAL
jgi:C1A family cysteine protease